jgi:hypothetical protein
MDRLGAYIQEFAELLGSENRPVFKGIKRASTGLKAYVPHDREHYAKARLVEAKQKPEGRVAKILRSLEEMLGQDKIHEAQILDSDENVIHVLHGISEVDEPMYRLQQQGTVDGTVTGLVGADDTMHLHVRDLFNRDLKLVIRDEAMARNVLREFRTGLVRFCVDGNWIRQDDGWVPEANRCKLISFESLEDDSPRTVLDKISAAAGNAWVDMKDPTAAWSDLRGLH